MHLSALTQPFAFEPLFKERVWGGRRLASLFRKQLPADVAIGESWEIVDRPEAQSVVVGGPAAGRTLHDLWTTERPAIFGAVPDSPRFPLLIKLLDARETLSVQVHPPESRAAELGGEAKTEFWYIADALPGAELFVGLTSSSTRETFENAIHRGKVEDELHRVSVRAGDAMFLPSGRVHAIGAGNVIVEIQENSDTTYRVFDWNRSGTGGPRELHIEESLRCIDFQDQEPALVPKDAATLAQHDLFCVDKWEIEGPRSAELAGRFAIVGCLSGAFSCGGTRCEPGGFLLLPATLADDTLRPTELATTLLRARVPPPAA